MACRIQGGVGPGGCDAVQWRDALLRYSAHRERLRDSLAAIACRLVISSCLGMMCMLCLPVGSLLLISALG